MFKKKSFDRNKEINNDNINKANKFSIFEITTNTRDVPVAGDPSQFMSLTRDSVAAVVVSVDRVRPELDHRGPRMLVALLSLLLPKKKCMVVSSVEDKEVRCRHHHHRA